MTATRRPAQQASSALEILLGASLAKDTRSSKKQGYHVLHHATPRAFFSFKSRNFSYRPCVYSLSAARLVNSIRLDHTSSTIYLLVLLVYIAYTSSSKYSFPPLAIICFQADHVLDFSSPVVEYRQHQPSY